MKKKISTKKLKKRLWDLFSLWVRLKDADSLGYAKCITCGKPYHFKSLNAGHYIHGKWTKQSGLDERNVWPQCVFCNKGLGGNQVAYADFLRGKIGQTELDAVHELSRKGWKLSTQEIEDITKIYEEKLKILHNRS